MSRARIFIWGLPLLVFALFTSWYTDFGGPLSQDEINAYMEEFAEQGRPPEARARIRKFLEEDTGRQFFMLNVLDYNENPPDVPGGKPGLNAQQLLNHYMEHMYAQLFQRACHPTIIGGAVYLAMDMVGVEGLPTAEIWDAGGMMRYRSRRTFMEIVTHPDMVERHEYKVAALDKTIAYPIEAQINLGDPRVLVGLILFSLAALLDILFVRRG